MIIHNDDFQVSSFDHVTEQAGDFFIIVGVPLEDLRKSEKNMNEWDSLICYEIEESCGISVNQI